MGLACYCLPLACFVYRLLAIVYRLLAIVCRLLATVYRLLLTPCYYCHLPDGLLLALTRCLLLFTVYPRCLQVLPLLLHTRVSRTGSPTHREYGIAFAIADPCRIRDCPHMLARHVNVHALITPAPGSIPRLYQPTLQKRPSVVTLAAHLSTYCSFPVSARSWLAHML